LSVPRKRLRKNPSAGLEDAKGPLWPATERRKGWGMANSCPRALMRGGKVGPQGKGKKLEKAGACVQDFSFGIRPGDGNIFGKRGNLETPV